MIKYYRKPLHNPTQYPNRHWNVSILFTTDQFACHHPNSSIGILGNSLPLASFITSPVSFAAAHATIKGAKERHVHEGSKLMLRCTVEDATEPLQYVFWFHNTTTVNYHPARPIRINKKDYSSTLSIANVRRSDAGQYRCEPHLATSANVTIHVQAGTVSYHQYYAS